MYHGIATASTTRQITARWEPQLDSRPSRLAPQLGKRLTPRQPTHRQQHGTRACTCTDKHDDNEHDDDEGDGAAGDVDGDGDGDDDDGDRMQQRAMTATARVIRLD